MTVKTNISHLAGGKKGAKGLEGTLTLLPPPPTKFWGTPSAQWNGIIGIGEYFIIKCFIHDLIVWPVPIVRFRPFSQLSPVTDIVRGRSTINWIDI